MSWEPGRERVRELIDAGEVDRVTPDLTIAHRMLEDAGRHLATASAAKAAGDLSGAYQLAYDTLRKSAASLVHDEVMAHLRHGCSSLELCAPEGSQLQQGYVTRVGSGSPGRGAV